MTPFNISLGKINRSLALFAIASGTQLMFCTASPFPGLGSLIMGLFSFALTFRQIAFLVLLEESIVLIRSIPYYRVLFSIYGDPFFVLGNVLGSIILFFLFLSFTRVTAWSIKKKTPKWAEYLASLKGENTIEHLSKE